MGLILFFIGWDIKRGRLSYYKKIATTPKTPSKDSFASAIAIAVPVVGIFFPDDVQASTQKKLIWAGLDIDVKEFLAIKIFAGGFFVALGLFFSVISSTAILMMLILAVIGYVAPDLWLTDKVKQRQNSIRSDMMEFGTLLSTTMKAGIDISTALTVVAKWFPGEISREIDKTYTEMSTGVPRSQALLNMADRCGVDELTHLMRVITQAIKYGTSIHDAIKEHTLQMIMLRRYAVEEQVGKTTVKMLAPMVICFLAPLFVLLMYPAMVNMSEIF